MSDFEIDMKFNIYDVMMLSQMIAHARRYGDNQVSDWAGELRDRIAKKAGFQFPITDIPNPLKDVSPETAARVAVDATQGIGAVAASMPAAKPPKPKTADKDK